MFIVAEAAYASEGKLYIHGGALTNIAPPGFPWMHPQLALVLRLVVVPDDFETEHSIHVALYDDERNEITPSLLVPVLPESMPPMQVNRPMHLNAALTIANVTFERPGFYDFVVSVDGVEVGSERLVVHEPRSAD